MRDQLLRERTDHLQDALAPIEPHSTHFADSATDEFDHDVTLAILRREENALREVEEAIERIHAGTYGICTVTMMPIPAQRLHALPWCRYALATERELEKNRAIMPTRVPPAVSLRGPTAGIPYSGTLSAEGMENEPVEREEPKAGRATTDSLPLDEDE